MTQSFPVFDDRDWGLDVCLGGERIVQGHRAGMGERLTPRVSAYLELVAPDRSDHSIRDLIAMLDHAAGQLAIDEPEAVAEFLLGSERSGPIPSRGDSLPDALTDWSHVDLWLFSSVAHFVVDRECPVAVHSGRALVSSDAFICVWVRTTPHHWSDLIATALPDSKCPEPLPERVRRHSYEVEFGGEGGHAEIARMTQDVLQHHEWAVGQLTARVEDWERRFYRGTSAPGSMFEGMPFDRFREDLAAIAEANLELRKVVRDLDRRARLDGLLVAPDDRDEDLRGEVMVRSAALERGTADVREAVREGFALLSSAASGAQVELQQGFQVAAGLVTGLVLIPGLVLGLYGAAVAGLPGQGARSGLAYAGAYSLIGAATTIAGLYLAHRRRWGLLTAVVVAGIGAVAGITLLR
jgi:hypothetical protein